MIKIKTVKNYFVTGKKGKSGYCFKSSTNQVLTKERLAKEFAKYNSTITEPDALGMLHILTTIIIKYVALGYEVDLPFCKIRLKATGTCDGIQESFRPGVGNHKFSIVVEFEPEALAEILKEVEYMQVKPGNSTDPEIYALSYVDKHQKEKEETTFTKGATLRIRGANLSVDLEDDLQGVFLRKGESQVRVDSYNRIGSNIIDVVIPSNIDAGTYYVVVVNTKHGRNSYKSDQASDPIVIQDMAA